MSFNSVIVVYTLVSCSVYPCFETNQQRIELQSKRVNLPLSLSPSISNCNTVIIFNTIASCSEYPCFGTNQ